jgi:long-subunit fatty acid transport protein
MTSRSLLRSLALCFAAALCLAAPAARANPYELFGFTPRSVGLAQANVALGDDLAGSFYNPAGMLGHTKSEFGLGVDYSRMMLHVDRGPASTVPNGYNDDAPRVELALIFPLGGPLFKDRVVLGVNLGHPMGALVRVQTIDQSKPQFYMYQSKPQRFATSASIGIKLMNGLSVGVGAQVIAEQIGNVRFQMDLAARRFVAREITIDLNTVPEPLAGILVEPTDWLKIGFSWRKQAQLYYAQPTDIDLGDLGDLQLNVHGIAQYWPHVFSLGASMKPLTRWLFCFQLDYLLWSRAPRDQVDVSLLPSGTVLAGLGLDAVLGFGSSDASPNFADILIPRAGVEYQASEVVTLRGGLSVRPPVTPDQVGTTNYLDNFTETIALGATFKFSDLLQVFPDPVSLDLGGSLMVANTRTSQKRQAADPTGSYSFGGSVLTVGAMLRYLY